jgi:ribokinase
VALLEATDWLVPNEVECAQLAASLGVPGAAAAHLSTLRPIAEAAGTGLVVTLGDAGAIAVDRTGRVLRAVAPHVAATDTTGAGDAFVGAFAYAMGRGADLATSLTVACALASDSVRRAGTQRSFPSSEDALEIANEAGLLARPRDHLPH